MCNRFPRFWLIMRHNGRVIALAIAPNSFIVLHFYSVLERSQSLCIVSFWGRDSGLIQRLLLFGRCFLNACLSGCQQNELWASLQLLKTMNSRISQQTCFDSCENDISDRFGLFEDQISLPEWKKAGKQNSWKMHSFAQGAIRDYQIIIIQRNSQKKENENHK